MSQLKQRTSVSLTNSGQILFERETEFFPGTPEEMWMVQDRLKVANFSSIPSLINLSPRKPGNVKREVKPKFGWAQDFVGRIGEVPPIPAYDGDLGPWHPLCASHATCEICDQVRQEAEIAA